ncbi:ribonuclease H-like domain-containing protein [Tanacetum coccineum]
MTPSSPPSYTFLDATPPLLLNPAKLSPIFHADGTLSRYKARLVANGSSQQLGVDFDETFNPVAKPTNVRTVLSFVVSHKWPIYQLDVKNAFLNKILVWTKTSTSCLVSARKYALQLLERAYMVNCNPSRTPVGTESKLGSNEVSVEDPTLYRSLAGGLLVLRILVFTYMHPPPPLWLVIRMLIGQVFHLHAGLAQCHFVRDMVSAGQVRVLHVSSCYQFANVFTKGLPFTVFEEFRSSLSVRPPSAPTVMAY